MKKHGIFETNPNLKEVHMTTDGEYFYNNNDAKMHAKTLKNKSVELIVNPDLIEVIADDVDTDDELKTSEGTGENNFGIEAKADGSINELNTETPVVETLKESETPKEDEAPVIETPVVEAPVVEAPVVEAPVIETPVVEAPVVEAPVIEAPKEEAPKEEAPKKTSKKAK